MNPDPADDTNALLRENNAILLQIASGRNDTFPSLAALPSETFKPGGEVLSINVLFSVSLTFAIISSFMAVLGRQWLYDYGKQRRGGAENQRWKRLRRFLGTKRWHLAFVLDDLLPSILQFGLIIFCISLTIYLGTLHPILSKVVGAFMGAGLAMLVGTAIGTLWDPFCPFQTPLSRAITWIIRLGVFYVLEVLMKVWILVQTAIVLVISIPFLLVSVTVWLIWRRLQESQMDRFVRDLRRVFRADGPYFNRSLSTWLRSFTTPILTTPQWLRTSRQAESIEALHAAATERVLSGSDDVATLITTISNVPTIQEPHIEMLTTDNEFCKHLLYLCKVSYSQAIQLLGRDQARLALAVTWRYRAAVGHTFLSSRNPRISFLSSGYALQDSFQDGGEPGLLIPLECIQGSSPASVDACLGYLACIAANDERYSAVLDQVLQLDFDELLSSDWRRISMIIVSIIISHRRDLPNMKGLRNLSELQAAYVGNPRHTLLHLSWALFIYEQTSNENQAALRRYLAKIFRVMVDAVTDVGSDGHASLELDSVAWLLCLYEIFVRVQDYSQDYLVTGRALRRDLISALHSGLQLSAASGSKSVLQDTIDGLFDLLADLTAADGQVALATNEDDLDLAALLIPLLRDLNRVCLEYQIAQRERGPLHTNVFDALAGGGSELPISSLNDQFMRFTSGISRISRHMKRRYRDPEMRWCHWQEEVFVSDGAGSRSGAPPFSVSRRDRGMLYFRGRLA